MILFVHKAFSALDFYLTVELLCVVNTAARKCFVRVLSLGNINIREEVYVRKHQRWIGTS